MAVNRAHSGVTLVELMVAIAVLAILAALAAPSFADFADRQALRGATDSISGVIASAREEAIKRDQWVRVDFKSFGTGGMCVGAQAVSSGTAATGCDCSSATACGITQYPERATDLRRVTVDGTLYDADGGFVIDPKTGTPANLSDEGAVALSTQRGYGATVHVNGMGRISVCSTKDKKALGGVKPC